MSTHSKPNGFKLNKIRYLNNGRSIVARIHNILRLTCSIFVKNSDGKLTKAEASRSGVTRDFDNIDANDDELITRTEFKHYQSKYESNSSDSSEEQ